MQNELQDYRELVWTQLEASTLAAFGEKFPSRLQKRNDDPHFLRDTVGVVRLTNKSIMDPVFPNLRVNHGLRRVYSSNPNVFRDAVVLDVGRGTSILSLFAAHAKVGAVDANKIADKAEEVVKTGSLVDAITCVCPLTSPKLSGVPTTCSIVRAKAEPIQLPPNTRTST